MATDADKSVVANAIIPSIIQFLVVHPEKNITSKNFAEIVDGIERERLLEAYATYQFVQAPRELAATYKMIKFVNKSRGGGSNVKAFFSYFNQYKHLFSIVPNGETILDAVPYLAKIDGSYFMKVYSAVQKIGQFMGDDEGLRVVEMMFDSTHKGESSFSSDHGYSPVLSGDYAIESVSTPVNVVESPEYRSVIVEKERLQKELRELHDKYNVLEETAKKMEEESRQYSEENEATRDLLAKEREKVVTAQKEVASVEKSKKSETQALREQITNLEKKVAALEKDKETQRQRVEELERVIKEFEENVNKKDAQMNELAEELEKAKKELADHGDVKTLVEESSEKSKKIIELEDMLEEKSMLLKAKETDLESIGKQIGKLEEKEELMEKKVRDLEESVREKSLESENERTLKEESVSRNLELEKRLEEMKENEEKIREVMKKNAETLSHTLRQQGRLTRALAQSEQKIKQLEESKK